MRGADVRVHRLLKLHPSLLLLLLLLQKVTPFPGCLRLILAGSSQKTRMHVSHAGSGHHMSHARAFSVQKRLYFVLVSFPPHPRPVSEWGIGWFYDIGLNGNSILHVCLLVFAQTIRNEIAVSGVKYVPFKAVGLGYVRGGLARKIEYMIREGSEKY